MKTDETRRLWSEFVRHWNAGRTEEAKVALAQYNLIRWGK